MKTIALFVAGVVAVLMCIFVSNIGLRMLADSSDITVLVGLVILSAVGATVGVVSFRGGRYLLGRLIPILVIAVVATGCGTTIQPGHAGIVVDAYGKDRGVQSYTASTGRVWYNPITTTVFEYPTFVQSVVFTHSVDEGKAVNEEITFTNADQMSIAADVSLSYSLGIDKLPAFYVKFRSDNLSQFTYGFLRSLMRDKFNEIAGKYTIAQIMGDNGPFLSEVKRALQAELEPIGVHLESQFGFIGAPRPPKQVIESINMKAQASQLALQKQNELVQVQADAAKEVARAEGHAKAVLASAEADARANRMLADSLTGSLVELKRLEKWNGVLPSVTGGAMPFISMTTPAAAK